MTVTHYYTFPDTGISLNECLIKMGIKTIERNGAKFLVYNGVEIGRPQHSRVTDKIETSFGISVGYNTKGITKSAWFTENPGKGKFEHNYVVYADGKEVATHNILEDCQKHCKKIITPLQDPKYKNKSLI